MPEPDTHISVWRPAIGVPEDDPSPTGSTQPPGAAARWQHVLDDHLNLSSPSLRRRTAIARQLAPQLRVTRTLRCWRRSWRRCRTRARTCPRSLSTRWDAGLLPDDHPVAALLYRLQRRPRQQSDQERLGDHRNYRDHGPATRTNAPTRRRTISDTRNRHPTTLGGAPHDNPAEASESPPPGVPADCRSSRPLTRLSRLHAPIASSTALCPLSDRAEGSFVCVPRISRAWSDHSSRCAQFPSDRSGVLSGTDDIQLIQHANLRDCLRTRREVHRAEQTWCTGARSARGRWARGPAGNNTQ